jgi:hypothetical protein
VTGQCTQIKANGERCQSRAIEGSERCFFHADPGKLLTATSLGGKQGKRKVLEESNMTLRSVDDVKLLLETTINEVRTGLLDRAIGNTVGYLAGILIKAFELSDADKKLDRVTEILTHE